MFSSVVRHGSGSVRVPNAPIRISRFGTPERVLERIRGIRGSRSLPQIPFKPTARPISAPSSVDVVLNRRRSGGAASLYYQVPVLLVEARGQYVFDEKGQRYLDMFGGDGCVTVGHCHPDIAGMIIHQATKLASASHYHLSEESTSFTEKLVSTFPEYLDTAILLSSESEAIEMAILLSRLYTRNHDIIALRGSHFGFTELANSVSGLALYKHPSHQVGGISHIRIPDFYRCEIPQEVESRTALREAVAVIRSSTSGVLAACLVELSQSLGGVTNVPVAFIQELTALTRQRGSLIIMDESNTGLGRHGKHLWAFEATGVMPDIVVVSKGLGNGLPLTAVVTSKKIADMLATRQYTNLYSGNPICSAAASAVLDVIDRDNLVCNVAYVGNFMHGQLKLLCAKHSGLLGDVRGQGLLGGIEIVNNAINKQPSPEDACAIHEALKNRGVLVGRGGVYGNVLRLSPPLCITIEDVQFMIEQLDQVTQERAMLNSSQSATCATIGLNNQPFMVSTPSRKGFTPAAEDAFANEAAIGLAEAKEGFEIDDDPDNSNSDTTDIFQRIKK